MRLLTRVPLLFGLTLLMAVSVGSKTHHPDASPPQAATSVGQDACATCHADVTAQYTRSAHGHIADFERRG